MGICDFGWRAGESVLSPFGHKLSGKGHHIALIKTPKAVMEGQPGWRRPMGLNYIH